jgi:hypothetical protein
VEVQSETLDLVLSYKGKIGFPILNVNAVEGQALLYLILVFLVSSKKVTL